ncbi:hypothetical protein L289_3981 [Acinetobacter gerneri DSM 14967 = CIP 107464 = MTCC 9824]|nr:hypothetical protein L289_3981 [Acinetobacter gerneri DSM 14967 = CIP 107464 = MTCC 9824]
MQLVIELKEKALEFDAINKQKHRENFDNWSFYNVWLDVVVSQFINRTIDSLQEKILIKKNHPEQYVEFSAVNVTDLSRIFTEKTVFNQGQEPTAFPSKQAEEEFYRILDKIGQLDNMSNLGGYYHAGELLGNFFNYISDNKERERKINYDALDTLREPEIYPTYLVYPKPFHTEQKVEIQGAYITDNPLKTCAFYSSSAEEFFQTKVSADDLPKLDHPIQRVKGEIEYGLYDPSSPYYDNPSNPYDMYADGSDEWIDTDWYFVKEIPPNTEGIPNNPLRLEDLRYPLKQGEKYISLDEIKQRDGYVYDNPNAMVENYGQVAYRYEKFYRDYLLKNGVNPDLLIHYQMK